MSWVLRATRMQPHGKERNTIVQSVMLCMMETVPITSSHVKKLKVTEMKTCRWVRGHKLRGHVRNDTTRETERESQRGAGKRD